MRHINPTENQKHSSLPWAFILLNTISFILLSIIALHRNDPYLFYMEDGHYMMNLAREDLFWRGYELGISSNFFQALGGPWFPIHTMFIPGYIMANLFSSSITNSQTAAYVMFALEIYLITLLVARSINLNWKLALATAWVLPLIAYPYYYNPVLYNIMSIVPHFGTMIVATNLMIILYAYIGKLNFYRSTLIASSIILLTLYLSIALPLIMMLSIPMAAIFCLVTLLSSATTSEMKQKFAFSLAMIFILAISGIIPYSYGIFKFTVPNYFPADLLIHSDKPLWNLVSILFQEKVGRLLYILAAIGTLFYSFYGEGLTKSLARGVLLSMLALLSFGVMFVKFEFWHGPVPLYFEFILWPFYIAFAIAFINQLLSFCNQLFFSRFQFASNQKLALFFKACIICLPWIILLHHKPHESQWSIPNPPTKTAIVNILDQEISLTRGSEYKGRVANYTGRKIEHGINWIDLAQNDYLILKKTGNEHRMNGLWFYNIPTLDVYGPFISPPYFQFAKSFLASPLDQQIRSIVTIRRIDTAWLAALGVKFIVTDLPINNIKLREKMPLNELGTLYLYELPQPNLGQYSPTRVTTLVNSKTALTIMAKNSFNPKNDAISDISLPANLIKAKFSKMFIDKGFIRVKASTNGKSILVLPFEFSNCLILEPNNLASKTAKLFRANLFQAGILFDHDLDISIRYFTGPFKNSTCRLKDAKDFNSSMA